MKEAIVIVLIIIVTAAMVIGLQPAYKQIETQYTRAIRVDKSEKIEHVLSNAVEDVTSRKFIVVSTAVKQGVVDDDFIVEVKGIDRAKLLSLGK